MSANLQPVKRKSPGRPTKYTPQTVERILRCVERGMPLALAANAASVSSQTLFTYRNEHPEFADALVEAIAKGVEARLKKIEEASDGGDWRASAWLLEHCQPEHFSKNRLEVTGADGSPLTGAVAVYLPQKDGNASPVINVDALKEIKDERH